MGLKLGLGFRVRFRLRNLRTVEHSDYRYTTVDGYCCPTTMDGHPIWLSKSGQICISQQSGCFMEWQACLVPVSDDFFLQILVNECHANTMLHTIVNRVTSR